MRMVLGMTMITNETQGTTFPAVIFGSLNLTAASTKFLIIDNGNCSVSTNAADMETFKWHRPDCNYQR